MLVRDLSGAHRDECFFTTDLSLSATTVVEMYTARWTIETTFQEMRSYLGLETTRGGSQKTMLRMAPCLFVLYTVVVLFCDSLPASSQATPLIQWKGKNTVTYSDMITSVRRYLWTEWVLVQVPGGEGVRKLSAPTRELIGYGLAQAA